jgi:hypothetical protein
MAKDREFDREVTVYVWRFRGVDHPGHAAVKLTGVPGRDKAYISWWPGGGGKQCKGKRAGIHGNYHKDMTSEISPNVTSRLGKDLQPRRGQRQVVYGYDALHERDLKRWGQEADEKIKLPGRGATGVEFGLDLVRMYEWWQVFQHCPHPRYKFASKHSNCSGVAAAALRVGGADQFASPPTALLFIDPSQVADWAWAVKDALAERNEAAKRLAVDLDTVGEVQLDPVEDLMTVPEWKQLSNRDMGGAFLRSPKVKDMDRLLQKYHTLAWNDEQGRARLIVLGKLMDTIHHYLAHKPGSKRGDAVLALGKQVLNVSKEKARHYRDYTKVHEGLRRQGPALPRAGGSQCQQLPQGIWARGSVVRPLVRRQLRPQRHRMAPLHQEYPAPDRAHEKAKPGRGHQRLQDHGSQLFSGVGQQRRLQRRRLAARLPFSSIKMEQLSR